MSRIERPRTVRGLVWAAVGSLFLGLPPALRASPNLSPGTIMSDRVSDESQCVGRFRFHPPAGFRVAARFQSIYRTEVRTLDVDAAQGRDYWSKRLGEIRSGANTPLQTNAFRTLDLAPDVRGVWYLGSPTYPDVRTVEVMRQLTDHVLLLKREADAGKEEVAQNLLREILGGYAPGSERGFCIGRGSITLQPSQNEESRLILSSTTVKDLELKIETRTAGAPDTTTFADVDEETQVAKAGGGQLTVLRNDARKAAGLAGKELWIQVVVPRESSLARFTWHFAGQPGTSEHPVIDIIGTARVEDRAALEHAWESVLGSLAPTEVGPR